jgi:hypothetical protein
MTASSFGLLIHPDRALDRVGNAIGLTVDLRELPPFNQETNFRLGPGITQEDAAFAGKFFLRFVHKFHDRWQISERRFFFDAEVALRLGVFF